MSAIPVEVDGRIIHFSPIPNVGMVCDCSHVLAATTNKGGLVKHAQSQLHKEKMEQNKKETSMTLISQYFKKINGSTPSTKPKPQSYHPSSSPATVIPTNVLSPNEDINDDDHNTTATNAPSISTKHRIVLVDENNNILSLSAVEPATINICSGVLPKCLEDIDGIDGSNYLIHLPSNHDAFKKLNIKLGHNGLHAPVCPMVLLESSDNKCNDICNNLRNNDKLNKIIINCMVEPNIKTFKNIRNEQLSYADLKVKCALQSSEIAKLRSKIQYRDRKLANQLIEISIHKRVLTTIANNDSSNVGRIINQYHINGCSSSWLLNKVTLYFNGCYAPKGMIY